MNFIVPNFALVVITFYSVTTFTSAEVDRKPLPVLGGYETCAELKQQLGMEDMGLIKEDLANFGWEYDDFVKALEYCKLPVIPELYVK